MACSEIAIPQHRLEINRLRADPLECLYAEITARDENVKFSRPKFNTIYIRNSTRFISMLTEFI